MEAKGPLRGLKVIDLSHVMAGPTCSLMLADMGADVIKVERIPDGDDVRRSIPPTVGSESAAFLMMNRSKRGIALDLKKEGGRRVLLRLAESADVLIENYRRGTMERLGVGYDDLKAVNPRIIYAAISGFGRSGPYKDRPGFDLIAQGLSGLMSITGEGEGRPPVKVGAPVTDITAGLLLALGIMSACYERDKTGEGQIVDTSLLEAGITHTYWQSAICMATGVSPVAMGSAHPLNAPYQAVQTSDGWINIGAANQANWLRLVDAIGAPALAEDPRFLVNHDRMGHLEELSTALGEIFARKSSAEWLDVLAEAGVPAGPILSIKEMHENEQTIARDMVVETDHATLGPVRTLGLPIKFSRTPGGVCHAAPVYAQHSEEVLREYGFSDAEIGALVEEGAVQLEAVG